MFESTPIKWFVNDCWINRIPELRSINSYLKPSNICASMRNVQFTWITSKMTMNGQWMVQNSLARTIYPSAKRSDHISPVLHKLHWLPVSSRIEFKIATLTFKVLKFQQPAYIYDLIAPYIPPRSLRSSNKNLLIVPDIRSEMGRRSFSFASPSIWNSLPQHIRSSDSLPAFRGLLKTYLYQKSLPP